ncbi:unnamed protein product [Caenorhabditis sp. 36 PRJEB53466]|nr:unnamed protein product [Caenorhabditis sp. 36 PRJEB53466]
MLKTVIFLGLCVSATVGTRFLFGVELRCPLDSVFEFKIEHKEADDGCRLFWCDYDDMITSKMTLTAWKKLFFYQDGSQDGDKGFGMYDPYALIHHNCSSDGKILVYRHNLKRIPQSIGLVFMDYAINLLDKSGYGSEE